MCQVPAGTSVCEWPGALAPGAPRRCVREGSMSAMERTTYRRSLGSNAWAFNEPRRDSQHASYASGPSTDFSSDDSIPLSDLQGQPDPREFAPLAASQRTSVLTRVMAGGLVVSAFAILVAVAARQIPLKDDPARASDPVTRASVNASASRLGTPSREAIISAHHTALPCALSEGR